MQGLSKVGVGAVACGKTVRKRRSQRVVRNRNLRKQVRQKV